VAFLSGDTAWNLAANGAPVPAPAESVPVADNVMNAFSVEARQLLLTITPHGWIKAAMGANPAVDTRTADGKRMSEVSFVWKGKYKVTGDANRENLLEKVETWLPDPILGDMLVEADYSDYKDFGGVMFPMKIVQKQGGFPVLDLTVNEVRPSAPVDIEVPQAVRDAVPPPSTVESQQVADGVWFLSASSHNGVVVEFNGYTAVIDAPLNETRSLAVIAEVKKLVPNKPLRYVINTHPHFDHSGGLRTYVAEGVTIITDSINRPFFERTFQLPHTLNPDSLSRNPKPAQFITVTDNYVLTDGTRALELYVMQNNTHNPGLLLAYLPKEKILAQADSYTPPTPNLSPPPAANVINARNLNLEENIDRLHLNVQKILPIHGRIMTIAEFRKAIGKGE
jgi:glyoxylase-like metal-dependent hydrolase (beta-lactamase superfamily II)